MGARIYTAAVAGYNGSLSTFYFCTGTGFISAAGDTPALTWYEPRITQPAWMKRDAFGGYRVTGRSSVQYGDLVLANPDGALDYMDDYEFDGRAITIKVGILNRPGTPTWTTVLTGTIEQATFGWNTITIRIRDRQIELDSPLQVTKYAGTNSGSPLAGIEGAADILGKPKPKTYGQVFNISPVQVNTDKLIYQAHDGAVASIDAVYDRGLALTIGTAYTNQSDMETNAPAAGYYRVWAAGGCFRITPVTGTTPAGLITADVTQGTNAAARTCAQLVKTIVTGPGAIAAGDITSGDITTLDSANSSVLGVYAANEVTISSQLDLLCASVGAYWGFDQLGKFRVRRLDAPSGSPDLTITTTEIISIERVPSKDQNRGVPSQRVNVTYKPNYTIQETDVSSTVTNARKAYICAGGMMTTAYDSGILTTHPLPKQTNIDTQLVAKAAADTEAARLLTLFGVRRDMFDVAIMLDGSVGVSLDIGSLVMVQVNRYGMNAGRLFVVIGLMPDLRRNRIDMTIWG